MVVGSALCGPLVDGPGPFHLCQGQLDGDSECGTAAPITMDRPFPFVGPDRDARVWDTLDEGCNAAFHSVGWYEKAQ